MKLDDFESVFRSAVKERFHLQAPDIASIMLITDVAPDETRDLEATIQAFLTASMDSSTPRFCSVGKGEYTRVAELVEIIEQKAPDLIVTYRHLLGREKDLRHSLGSFIDSLTQLTSQPVLLVPPLSSPGFAGVMSKLEKVLVVTDHIVGDDRLVNWGLTMCPEHGTVVLAHVEDDATFRRYSELLGMIPDMDTELLLKRLTRKLLGRPRDYIDSIIEALAAAGVNETVVPVVTMGHALSDYKRIIDEHDIDLVVLNTKDDHQLAMQGMAYALSVEIMDRPLLLL